MEKLNLLQVQKVYFDFLKEAGYNPKVDESNDDDEGDLLFEHEETTFRIGIDDDDLDFFELGYVCDLDCEVETEEEQNKLYRIASETTQVVKYAKVSLLIEEKVLLWITVERIMDQQNDINKYFKRMFESIQEAIEYFMEKFDGKE